MFKHIINIMQLKLSNLLYIIYIIFELVQFWPIAISIKSKLESSNKTKATIQLAV